MQKKTIYLGSQSVQFGGRLLLVVGKDHKNDAQIDLNSVATDKNTSNSNLVGR